MTHKLSVIEKLGYGAGVAGTAVAITLGVHAVQTELHGGHGAVSLSWDTLFDGQNTQNTGAAIGEDGDHAVAAPRASAEVLTAAGSGVGVGVEKTLAAVALGIGFTGTAVAVVVSDARRDQV